MFFIIKSDFIKEKAQVYLKKSKPIISILLSILSIIFFSPISFANKLTSPMKIQEIFPDENFAIAVKQHLKKSSINDYVSQDELNSIEKFDYRMNNKISINIEGIQYLNDLKYCAIIGCQLTDIGRLSQLTKLSTLFLSYNCLFDLTPLSNLNNLTHLELSNNQISNLQPLSSLNNLCWLEIAQNQIEDISPLKRLKKLKTLNIVGNPADYTQLASLKGLRIFYLDPQNMSNTYLSPGSKPNFIWRLFGWS